MLAALLALLLLAGAAAAWLKVNPLQLLRWQPLPPLDPTGWQQAVQDVSARIAEMERSIRLAGSRRYSCPGRL